MCFLVKIDKALRCISVANISACEYHTENREQRSITEDRDTKYFHSLHPIVTATTIENGHDTNECSHHITECHSEILVK